MIVSTSDDLAQLPEMMRAVMSRAGIRKVEHAKTLSSIIGVSVPQAYKKLNGGSDMTLPQIDAFNRAFEVQVLSTSVISPDHPLDKSTSVIKGAYFIVGPGRMDVSCTIVVGVQLRSDYANRFAAFRSEGTWFVDEVAACPGNAALYEIEKLTINLENTLPRSAHIAVVDDERGTADNLRDFLTAKGYVAEAFYDLNSARAAIDLNRFDGYFLDWRLGDGTSESLIKFIRSIQPLAPIVVSTAGGADGGENRAVLDALVVQYNVSCHRKPTPMKLLTSIMASSLGEGK